MPPLLRSMCLLLLKVGNSFLSASEQVIRFLGFCLGCWKHLRKALQLFLGGVVKKGMKISGFSVPWIHGRRNLSSGVTVGFS